MAEGNDPQPRDPGQLRARPVEGTLDRHSWWIIGPVDLAVRSTVSHPRRDVVPTWVEDSSLIEMIHLNGAQHRNHWS